MGNSSRHTASDTDISKKHGLFHVINQHPKKISLGLAIVLALFVTPLLVAANSGSSDKDSNEIHTNIQTNSKTDPLSDTSSAQTKSSTSITTQGSSNNAQRSSPNLRVQVNGKNMPVPTNGSVHHELHDSNGQTNVDIRVDNNSSSSTNTSSSSSTNVDVSSDSSQEVVQENY